MTVDIKSKILEAKKKADEEREKFESGRLVGDDESQQRKLKAEAFLGKCRHATAEEYAKWVDGYLAQGGEITHCYNYDFPSGRRGGFYTANEPITVTELFGADAVRIISDNVPVQVESRGHNDIYTIIDSEFVTSSPYFVPMYNDVAALLGAEEYIDKESERPEIDLADDGCPPEARYYGFTEPKPDIQRLTMEQVSVKSSMGFFQGLQSFAVKFHWKFWSPIDAIGGKVYFGSYGEYDANEIK